MQRPVIYIDDRWLYDLEAELEPVVEISLASQQPLITDIGSDLTIVASGHASLLARDAAKQLKGENISVEVIDIRVFESI